jgi:hypothetical protein
MSSHGPPDQLRALYNVFADHLRPKRLAILVDKPLYATIQLDWTTTASSPDFSLGLFDNLTHLSIVNKWTDWNAWIWNQDSIASLSHDILRYRIDSKCLPKLTHLSLEIQVARRSYTNYFQGPTNHVSVEPGRRLAESVGLSLARILASFELRVLLCIVTFDDLPLSTARLIREVTASNTEVLGSLEALPFEPCRGKRSSKIGDPRLVFAHDRDPFREREAGSYKVWNMWKRAEEIVRLQIQGQLPDTYGQCFEA